MTLAQVAADAGVTRPTLYKRWPSKAELVTAALQVSIVSERIERQRVHELPARDAIRAALHTMAEVVATPEALGLIGSVLVEERHTPGLFDQLRQHMVEPGLAQLVAVLERAQRDGVLRPDLDIDTLVAMLCGAMIVVYLRLGKVDDTVAERALAAIWPAVAQNPD
jgi:AcrR family transcriptional regulator